MAKVVGFLVAIAALLSISVWQFREAQRLERILGSKVGFLQAAGAFKLRLIQRDRASYPDEWHRGARKMRAADAIRVTALLILVALFAWSM